MKPIREVLAPARVIAAYEKTGLEVVRESWSGHGCACAAVVVAIADDKLSHVEIVNTHEDGHSVIDLVAHALEIERAELFAFIVGFDSVQPTGFDEPDSDPDPRDAVELGREVRRAVQAWAATRGGA